ncbi:RNA polymerase sigma factor [Sphingobacterium sp. LRF_L2]|uniref:RNA polymerase sigma factor n=1 Tax=Sphingobacterium sp. LRF_L2 TaxID=3369421 RepID=UPI003F61B0F6
MKQAWISIRQGDQESFMALYDAYYSSLFQYGLSIGKEREIVKESIHILFCEIWENRVRLSIEVQDPKFYLFTWLKRIILRQLKEQGSSPVIIFDEQLEDSAEAQQIAWEQHVEMQSKLDKALAQLTKKQRHYVELRFFQNKSYEQIAIEENAAVRTVYNVIYEALKNLKGQIIFLLLSCFKFF